MPRDEIRKGTPVMSTLGELGIFRKIFIENWRNTLVFSLGGEEVSYGQMWNYALSLTKEWRARGARPGDKIAFILPNQVTVLALYLACFIEGYTAVPINPETSQRDRERLLQFTRPTLVVSEISGPDVYAKEQDQESLIVSSDPCGTAAIMFSSGSTGEPKGICLQRSRILGAARAFGQFAGMNESTRMYHALPMFYNAGLLNAFLAPLMVGGAIIEGPQFSFRTMLNFWKRPIELKANYLCLTPTIAEALCQLVPKNYNGEDSKGSIANIICSGSSLTDETREKFRNTFGISLRDCYGITELGGPVTLQSPEDAMTSVDSGSFMPGVDYELRSVGEGSDELWLKSKYEMQGYFDVKGFSKTVDRKGCTSTGDLAKVNNGRLDIVGRSKDVIIRGGENINPLFIENELCRVPGVMEVAVIGEKHVFWGESVTACVRIKNKVEPCRLRTRIYRYVEENLSPIYRPDRIVFVTDYPRTSIGKIKKQELKGRLVDYKIDD